MVVAINREKECRLGKWTSASDLEELVVDLSTNVQLKKVDKLSYSGRWKKNKLLSDPMDKVFEMFNISWVLQNAIRLLNIIQVSFNF